MPKIHDMGQQPEGHMFVFHCPGCNYGHSFTIPKWNFNGLLDKPTVRPSLNVNPSVPLSHCHFHITDGMISFLTDCWHELAGQTVELPDWED